MFNADDEEGEELFAYAVDGAERMRSMIDGLLQYSRIETMGSEFEPVDPDVVFDGVSEDLRVKIDGSGAEITVDQLPRVTGDENQVRQVFQDLLSNAIKFSGEEPPRIHVSAELNGDEWIVSVADQGIGIAPTVHEQIFEVFEGLHGGEEYAGAGSASQFANGSSIVTTGRYGSSPNLMRDRRSRLRSQQ